MPSESEVRSAVEEVYEFFYDRTIPLLTGVYSEKNYRIQDTIQKAVKFYGDAHLASGGVEKKEEYTSDHNLTHGGYSHTEDGKRWFDLEYNQGWNACCDAHKLAGYRRVPSVEEICDAIEDYQVLEKEYKPIECGENLVPLAEAIQKLIRSVPNDKRGEEDAKH